MLQRVLWTEESLVAAADGLRSVAVWCLIWIRSTKDPKRLYGIVYSCSLNGRLLVHSFYRSTVAVASYVRNRFFVSRGCGYIQSNHSSGLSYDKIDITIECFALVTILGNELVIFPGIAFYYGNNYILSHVHVHASSAQKLLELHAQSY